MDAQIRHVGAYPLVKYYIEKLNLPEIFDRYISQGRSKVKASQALCVMITNIILASRPLYLVEEWLADYTDVVGKTPLSADSFNDDCLARNLTKLFEAPRQEMMTEISLKAIDTYQLETNRIHNDSTTITFYGDYRYPDPDTVQLVPGFNKDHRPDLKQVVFGLNITEDGHVPIDHQLFDGNRTDDSTHVDNWCRLRDLLQKQDFVYIADSKLSTKENLNKIHHWEGKFISILPRTRKEVTEFYQKIREKPPKLVFACRKESSRKKGTFIDYHIYDQTMTEDGFRLLWVHSSAKQKQDANRRQAKIQRICQHLEDLTSKLNRYQLKTANQIEAALDKIVGKDARFFHLELKSEKTLQKVQIGRGRPSANTQYRTEEHIEYRLEYRVNAKEIEADATKDGFFPLVTNIEDDAATVLDTYKNQPYLEKRFSTLKSVTDIAPVYLKTPKRIEAMMFLYFIALMIISLMERNIRKAMQDQNIGYLRILPNKMKTKRPTLNNIRYYFRKICIITITAQDDKEVTIKGLNKTHYQLTRLLGVPIDIWIDLTLDFWKYDSG